MNSDFPTQESANKPDCLLLLHGLGASTLELNWLAIELGKSGFRVETPTIQGYSFGTEATEWRLWIDICKAEVTRLLKESETVSVCGVSMGATLALALAESTDNLTCLVALSTTLMYDGWAVPWYAPLISIVPAVAPFFRTYRYHEREPFGVKNRELRAHIKRALQENRISEIGAESLSLKHISEANKLCRFVRKRLDQITVDTLVIHAVDDETASSRNAELVIEKISSRRKIAMYLGDSYHMITVDNERESVSEEVKLFVQDAIARTHSRFDLRHQPPIHPQLMRRLRSKRI